MAARGPENTFRQHLEAGDDDTPATVATTRSTAKTRGVKVMAVIASLLVLAYMMPYLYRNWKVEDIWNEALAAENEGRDGDAAKCYERVLGMSGISADYRNQAAEQLANVLVRMVGTEGNGRTALEHYERIRKLSPEMAFRQRISTEMMLHHILLKEYSQARALADQAKREAAGDAIALAKIEQYLGMVDRGEKQTPPASNP